MLHVGLSGLYLRALPAFNWPDEPAHFNYVSRLAEGRGLGVMEPSVWRPDELERLKRDHFESIDPLGDEIAAIRYEAHQPPLYYAAAALVYAAVPRLTAVKLLNLLLSIAVVILIWLCGRRLFPDRPSIRWGATLLAALLPMRCFMAVSIGNAIAAELFFAIFVLALATESPPGRIGLVVGCGLWVHTSLLLALPLYAVWLLLVQMRSREGQSLSLGSSARSFAIATLVAVAVWSPWLVHNISTYGWGDPLALTSGALGSEEAVRSGMGEARPRLGLAGPNGIGSFVSLLFSSFWGVFGWMEMFFSRRIQGLFAVLSLVPATGLLALVVDRFRRRQATFAGRERLLWLAVVAAAFFAALVVYSLFDFQPQGRYLLMASVAFSLLYGAGAERVLGRWTPAWLVSTSLALVLVNIYGALWVVPWYLAR